LGDGNCESRLPFGLRVLEVEPFFKKKKKKRSTGIKVAIERLPIVGYKILILLKFRKNIYVSILASFCVWTKSLKCKDVVNRDSTIQSLQVRRIQVPCQPSG
jgi:hypothetical protein